MTKPSQVHDMNLQVPTESVVVMQGPCRPQGLSASHTRCCSIFLNPVRLLLHELKRSIQRINQHLGRFTRFSGNRMCFFPVSATRTVANWVIHAGSMYTGYECIVVVLLFTMATVLAVCTASVSKMSLGAKALADTKPVGHGFAT